MKSFGSIDLNHCRIIREIKLNKYKYIIFIEKATNKVYLQVNFNEKIQSSEEEKEFTAKISKISRISSHPSLLPILDSTIKDSFPTITIEYPQNGYLFSKYGSPKLTGTKKIISLLGISAGMHFYYLNRINHGSLKPSDIFLDENLYPHVMNIELPHSSSDGDKFSTLMKAQTDDIKSFGQIAYEIITGKKPLTANDDQKQPDLSAIKSSSLRSFVQNCLSADSFSYPNFYQIFNELLTNRNSYKSDIGAVNEEEVDRYIESINNYLVDFSKKLDETASQPKISPSPTFECVFGQTAVVGQLAPDFRGKAVMPNLEFADIELSQFRGRWLVLFSYPLDFTFVCPTEIIQFSEDYDKFRKIDCEVIGLSVDSVYAHLAWMQVERKDGGIGNINYPLVGDLGGFISRKFGFYMEDADHDLRGTVIIDPEGVVRHVSMNHPDVGRNVDEVLRLVKALKFAAEHGEVCPAQWNEGEEAIKPNPKDASEYFRKH